jgi:hypothetical protein
MSKIDAVRSEAFINCAFLREALDALEAKLNGIPDPGPEGDIAALEHYFSNATKAVTHSIEALESAIKGEDI